MSRSVWAVTTIVQLVKWLLMKCRSPSCRRANDDGASFYQLTKKVWFVTFKIKQKVRRGLRRGSDISTDDNVKFWDFIMGGAATKWVRNTNKSAVIVLAAYIIHLIGVCRAQFRIPSHRNTGPLRSWKFLKTVIGFQETRSSSSSPSPSSLSPSSSSSSKAEKGKEFRTWEIFIGYKFLKPPPGL